MKTLLLMTLLFAGLNCQGQATMNLNDVPDFKDVKKRISQLETSRSVQLSVLKGLFNQMLIRIDSLEKRVKELEYNCLILVADSIPHYYPTFDDSLVVEYEKWMKIEPFKKENK